VFTAAYWRDLAERVLGTMAAAAIPSIPASLFGADWRVLLGLTLSAGLVTLLKCLAARAVNTPETASLVQTYAPATYVYRTIP